MSFLQEVKWRGHAFKMMELKGMRYNLWSSGNGDGVVGVKVMMMDQLCEKVEEVRKVSNRMMFVLLVSEDDALRLIYWYTPESSEDWKNNSFLQ